MNMDCESAWVEGFVTGLAEVREIVDELLARSDSCIRGGKANSYLRELIKRWPIPDQPIEQTVVETELEVDGRWIAEIPDLPGVMAYGQTKEEAVAHAAALALRVVADRMDEQKRETEQREAKK